MMTKLRMVSSIAAILRACTLSLPRFAVELLRFEHRRGVGGRHAPPPDACKEPLELRILLGKENHAVDETPDGSGRKPLGKDAEEGIRGNECRERNECEVGGNASEDRGADHHRNIAREVDRDAEDAAHGAAEREEEERGARERAQPKNDTPPPHPP